MTVAFHQHYQAYRDLTRQFTISCEQLNGQAGPRLRGNTAGQQMLQPALGHISDIRSARCLL